MPALNFPTENEPAARGACGELWCLSDSNILEIVHAYHDDAHRGKPR